MVRYVLGKYTDSAKAKIEGPSVKPSIEQLSKEEVERRVNLLREDSELQRLHRQFVMNNILTEAEFWATRKKLLDGDKNRNVKQRVGFKSAMISSVKPQADGRV
ncbi:hypothetical protein V2J09_022111 [Rumex salicifolius]